jgi:hypothetical protein
MSTDRGATHDQGGQVQELARILFDICAHGTVLFSMWLLF